MFSRIHLNTFEFTEVEDMIISLPAQLPYRLLATAYTNLGFINDVMLNVLMYICPSEWKFPIAPAKVSLQSFTENLEKESCSQLRLDLSESQVEAIHSKIDKQKVDVDLSDLESGLNIPFGKNTLWFCWKNVRIYALVYSSKTALQEVPKIFSLETFYKLFITALASICKRNKSSVSFAKRVA